MSVNRWRHYYTINIEVRVVVVKTMRRIFFGILIWFKKCKLSILLVWSNTVFEKELVASGAT